jgi:CheY-like chemotaxis protein/nitrogen-specific signal transduction histidine kinase
MERVNLTDSVPILIVDDRPENLLSLEGLLGGLGYELIRASSGNEALLQTLKKDFALVLMDVQMPEMDGFETAELMRTNSKTRHIPIIFLTAGMKDFLFEFKGYDAGAVDYLAKPVEPLFLLSKVGVFAELYRQRREIERHNTLIEDEIQLRTGELYRSSEELKIINAQLESKNRELKATEELLRGQITEFVETHDQLLTTEEMLRVQIGEFEIGQKQLNESNRNLQTLFDVTPLAIAVTSFPGGVIREINCTFSDDFGYTGAQVIGRTGADIGLWSDIEGRDFFVQHTNNQQGVSGFEMEIKTCFDLHRKAVLYSNIIEFKDDACLLIVFLDVTEQKRMEDQIRHTQKMDVIGQLAGGVAHDFNNMLTAIMGSAELLGLHVTNDPGAMKLLINIQHAAGRSAELTGQLLAFSRKGQKNTIQVKMDAAIHEVISLLERTVDKIITLETRLMAKNSCVIGDPMLLQNALLNLGVNARDAMPSGGF